MARIDIDLPDSFDYTIDFKVRMSEVNMGGHLGNHTLISLLNETYLRFLKEKGVPRRLYLKEILLVNTGLAVAYKSEAFHGNRLKLNMGIEDVNRYGPDFVFRVDNTTTGKLMAAARINMIFMDNRTKKAIRIPEGFKQALSL